jgi:two-component system NarL family sensor kinase
MKKNKSPHPFVKEELLTRLEIQERSLKLFAKEIYENIGQILSLARLQLGTLDLHNKQESEEKIGESRKLVGRAIRELRNLAKQLSPDEIIRKGFADAIHFELERLREAGLQGAGFRSEGDYYKLDPLRELVVFGIVQGLICKVLTYGNTKQLQIEMSYLPEQIVICTKFRSAEKDIPALISDITTDNKFLHGTGIVRGHIDSRSDAECGEIRLTIKKN